ncbi:MAG: hypothetical protein KDD94_09770, partial [Calditrichaeota bacterium]|nr:hypothetical protein [Calditrichota bacterium]
MSQVKDIYLCPPEHLELAYSINPWMDPDDHFSREKAMSEWKELVSIYQELIPDQLILVPAKAGLTELCFIGDSVFLYGDKAVFSRFAAKERYNETEYVMSYFQELGLNCIRVPETMSYEGSGETMVWNDRVLVGYGQRSSAGIDSYLSSF